MATDNTVTLIGNLTDDPDLKFTPNGNAVANFRLAVTARIKDGDREACRPVCPRSLVGTNHRTDTIDKIDKTTPVQQTPRSGRRVGRSRPRCPGSGRWPGRSRPRR
jgi:Single-strand binding protein family